VKPLRIAIDARKLSDTGIGRFSINLIREIAFIDRYNLYHILVRKRDVALITSLSLPSNFSIRPTTSSNYSVGEIIEISALASLLGFDLWISSHYVVPPFRRCALIATVHDLIHLRQAAASPVHRLYAYTMLTVACRADSVVTWSLDSMRDIRERRGTSSGITLISGAPAAVFHSHRSEEDDCRLRRLGLAPPYVLYVGMIKPHKNLDRLVCAFAEVVQGQSHLDRLKLALIASPALSATPLQGTIDTLGVGGRVEQRSNLSDEDVAAIMRHAELLVLPSLIEGYGLPIIEAMACGTPVVASNCPALRETAQGAAELVDPLEIVSIAKGLREVLLDNDVRARLVAAGHRRVAGLTWRDSATKVVSLYAPALEHYTGTGRRWRA